MIKKLRLKFIGIAMGSLCVIFLLLLGAIYYTMLVRNERQTNLFMENLADNDGVPPRRAMPPNNHIQQVFPNIRLGNIRSFFVKLDQNNEIIETADLSKTNLTSEDINSLLSAVLNKDKSSGSVGEYHFLIADKDYGKIIIFTDYSIENSILKRLVYTCLTYGGVGVILFFVIIVLLSYWATKPIQTAFDKQRQFVSDASHELKTPLTIISTNASVLSNSIGENKWLTYIQSNISRMNLLVNDLLNLTRMENGKQSLSFDKFNLSKAILSSALPFESTAYETGRYFNLSIPENIIYYGNEESIKQMIAILLDNAFKYSNPEGTVAVSLSTSSNKRIIGVYNTGAGIPREDYQKIFERFYRSDASRARNTGGYGLGLAIAKSIVQAHKGHIFVEGAEGQWVAFTIIF